MSPLTFEPILKRARWGGTRLGSELGKSLGPETDYAESWELADHGADQTTVIGGEAALHGCSLQELVERHNKELFGKQAGWTQFPLLIKFLDANDWLSLQVHPNDVQARTYDPVENGKTEAWIILDAQPGSQICSGLKSGVTAEDFAHSLRNGTVEETLHMAVVQAGDCVFVPAGTVHAIGPGILLAEVQQQSDLTFRLHDWGRMGTDGKPRQLHIEESMACIDFERGPVEPVRLAAAGPDGNACGELVSSDYFQINRHEIQDSLTLDADERCRILIFMGGNASVQSNGEHLAVQRGRTVLLPANCVGDVSIVPSEQTTVLEVSVPQQ